MSHEHLRPIPLKAELIVTELHVHLHNYRLKTCHVFHAYSYDLMFLTKFQKCLSISTMNRNIMWSICIILNLLVVTLKRKKKSDEWTFNIFHLTHSTQSIIISTCNKYQFYILFFWIEVKFIYMLQMHSIVIWSLICYKVIITLSLVTICHHTIDPLHPFHPHPNHFPLCKPPIDEVF